MPAGLLLLKYFEYACIIAKSFCLSIASNHLFHFRKIPTTKDDFTSYTSRKPLISRHFTSQKRQAVVLCVILFGRVLVYFSQKFTIL